MRFDAAVRPHLNAMYRMAYRWTQNRDDAEDLVQETLTKLVRRIDELESVEKLKPWLIKVLYRSFVDIHRKQSRELQLIGGQWRADTALFDEMAATVEEGTDEFKRLELQRVLIRALQTLNEDQRNVVLLHDSEGYTAEEIAGILDISVGTVKSRLHRAREGLKKTLKEMEPFSDFVRVEG
jgi:RNA polymerase sigma-70 factor (ECF subfamily)